MDIEFIYLDTMEALRSKLPLHRTFADAARAVEERFEAGQNGHDGDVFPFLVFRIF